MKKFKLTVELSFCSFSSGENTEFFETEDDATEQQIDEMAHDTFNDMCSWGFSEVKEGNNK